MPFALRQPPDPGAAEAWFASPHGQRLLAGEADCVRAALRQFPRQACLWLAPAATPAVGIETTPPPLRLSARGGGLFGGDLRCGLPLPLASESCAVIVAQHVVEVWQDPAPLLDECTRVLIPGGWMWLLALNPIGPYSLRWRGHGLCAREPVGWRRRLRASGLQPEPVSQGIGPRWSSGEGAPPRPGVGLRAAFLLRAEKRTIPLTPRRAARITGWQAETPA